MEPKLFKFPHIGKYSDIVGDLRREALYAGQDENGDPIYDEGRTLPSFEFTGTVKLHGANTGVCDSGDRRWAQTRNQLLEPGMKHYSFQEFMDGAKDAFDGLFALLRELAGPAECHIIYGEWCGEGINKGTAIHKLPRLYAIFAAAAVRDGGRTYLGMDAVSRLSRHDRRVFNVHEFGTFKADVDLADPAKAAERVSEITEEAGARCPAGRFFGVDGKGEGIVWTLERPGQIQRFKSKIAEFDVIQKQRKPGKPRAAVEADPEEIGKIADFVAYAVTDNRIDQGIAEVCGGKASRGKEGEFISWILRDVMREENAVIEKGGLNKKKAASKVREKALELFSRRLAEG